MRARRRGASHDGLAVENARLAARVRELQRQLERERARADGLARGLSALSEAVAALRGDAAARPRV